MACKVEQTAALAIWPALLACKSHVGEGGASTAKDGFFLLETAGGWRMAVAAPADSDASIVVFVRLAAENSTPDVATHEFCFERFLAGEPALAARGAVDLHPQVATILRMYLPLILGGWRARLTGETFVSAHVAQTLDGRIACNNGHSQWISNEANLWHAHRLRALHDAVLVGGHTVDVDDPKLTVRHVHGEDPTRVILSGSGRVLSLAGQRTVFDAPGCTVICREDALVDWQRNGVHEHVDVCGIPAPSEDGLGTADVLAALAARGLHSVFIEGGSATLSSFLAAAAIDVLHVHVAPMILGSGVPSFSLPEVTHIRKGQHLRMHHFEMDDELLFECRTIEEQAS